MSDFSTLQKSNERERKEDNNLTAAKSVHMDTWRVKNACPFTILKSRRSGMDSEPLTIKCYVILC